jgi:hypothetical protein
VPLPLAARPTFVFELVQLYTVPETKEPVGVIAAAVPPLQVTWKGEKLLTLGLGLTVTVTAVGEPTHELEVEVGVTLYTMLPMVLPELVNV